MVLDVFPLLTLAQNTALASTGAPGASFHDDNEAAALEQASAGAIHAREAGFTAEARAILAAPTWEGITQVADEIDAAVIVIGSRGFQGLREVVEGSVSHAVAEHAGRPVLIVLAGQFVDLATADLRAPQAATEPTVSPSDSTCRCRLPHTASQSA